MDTPIWVGLLKTSGHALATFLIGEFIGEDEHSVTIRNIVRGLEGPNPQGGFGMSYLTDMFFTTDCPVRIERTSLLMSRLLDPDTDRDVIGNIRGLYLQKRMSRAGIVPGTVQDPAARRVLQEKS